MQAHLRSGRAVLGPDSPFSAMLQEMINSITEGELIDHLEEQHAAGIDNKRNGKTTKSVRSNAGMLNVTTPRDRNGSFQPQLVRKRQTALGSGLDDQILALYAQGNSLEDVQRLLQELYGVTLSTAKLSNITDQVIPVIEQWCNRQLHPFYAVVYLDAMHFKVRHEGRYESRAFYTVYSVDFDGQRDVLGLYVQGSEGASRWGRVLEDLKRRGVEDIVVLCTDDLSGFSEVMHEVFPAAVVQKCIVHQVRNSVKFVDEKDRKAVCSDLRKIYRSGDRSAAKLALKAFELKWGSKYKYIVQQWRKNWDELMAFLDFPEPMRRMIYTTNPVEALHRIIRKLVKAKAAWVSDTALIKQIYLSLMHNEKSWRRKAYNWKIIQRTLVELYPDRTRAYHHD